MVCCPCLTKLLSNQFTLQPYVAEVAKIAKLAKVAKARSVDGSKALLVTPLLVGAAAACLCSCCHRQAGPQAADQEPQPGSSSCPSGQRVAGPSDVLKQH